MIYIFKKLSVTSQYPIQIVLPGAIWDRNLPSGLYV